MVTLSQISPNDLPTFHETGRRIIELLNCTFLTCDYSPAIWRFGPNFVNSLLIQAHEQSVLFVGLFLIPLVLSASSASNQFVTFNDSVMNWTFNYPDDFQSLPSAQPLLNQAAGCIALPLCVKGKHERPYERILIS